MPTQPPRFRAPGSRAHKPWAPTPAFVDTRKRGRAGQRDRAAVIAEEPLCRLCLAKGVTRATDIVDHIKPLREGGLDVRANKQGLCKPCHDAKSLAERAAERKRRGAA
jgi:5-methylcytosine-specific restriction protein A